MRFLMASLNQGTSLIIAVVVLIIGLAMVPTVATQVDAVTWSNLSGQDLSFAPLLINIGYVLGIVGVAVGTMFVSFRNLKG